MPFSPDSYAPANIDAFDMREEAIVQTVNQQAAHTSEGQQFSGIHVVKDTNLPTVFRPNSLFGDTGNTDQQYLAAQYDAAFPNHNYLTLDMPAHGQSDSLTKAQRKAVHDGDLSLLGAAQFEAATDINPNLNNLVVTSEALAHPISLAFTLEALKQGVAVKNVIGFDPLALERRNPLSIAGGYLFNAQKSRNERKKQADDEGEERLEDSFKAFEARVAEKYGSTKHATRPDHVKKMAKQREIATFMLRKSLFTHDTGMRLLSELVATDDEVMADLVFAGRSVIGRPTEPVMATLANLSKASDGRVRTQIWPHDNQDLGLARHQPRNVHFAADIAADIDTN